MPDLPPTEPELAHFGKYLLDQEIARGGMSRVYRARLRGPGGFEKKLVVKQILPELARDPSFIDLFVKEANTLVQMSHPNLVPVYELGVVDGVYFLAMEWVQGATIAELLKDGPLPARLLAHVGAQIAEALRYAHERFSIVHRDVTPRNVIIDSAGQARLLDFGIAAPVENTGTGELFGSPGYMAPEQLRGESLGPESDLFALGAVLHEAASGKPIFEPRVAPTTAPSGEAADGAGETGETPSDSSRWRRQRPDSVPQIADMPELDPTLRELIVRMVSTDRSARPQHAAEVASALRTWLAQHHPQGVERELGLRAAQRHGEREAAPQQNLASAPPSESSGRIEVRSIATSPVLDELLKHATERIERQSPLEVPPLVPAGAETQPEPPLTAAGDPEFHFHVRRLLRDIVVLTGALSFAMWSAVNLTHHDPDEDLEPIVKTVRKPGIVLAPPPTAAEREGRETAELKPNGPIPADLTQHRDSDSADSDLPKKLGYLTVSAAPWAQVQLDGHDMGATPRRKLPVRAGKHTLLVDCPPLGKQARLTLEIKPGDQQQIVVDLQTDPPTIVKK